MSEQRVRGESKMKQAKWLLVGIAMVLAVGCASGPKMPEMLKAKSQAPADPSKPSLVESKGDSYHVYKHKGRLYVIGSQDMSQQFAEQGHLPYTRTIIGGGPKGETVVYEVKKKEPVYVDRLMAQFKSQP